MNRSIRAAFSAAVFCLMLANPGVLSAGVASDSGDGDGIPDVLDKCSLDSRNATAPATCDTDCDGYGNVCDADFDQSFSVNVVDFTMFFVPHFKTGTDPQARGIDMDCAGAVAPTDFTMFFVPKFKGALGGPIPGPSGLACAGQPGCGC